MKISRISTTTLLVLLLGFILPAFAGQDKPSPDKEHAKPQNTHQQPGQPQQARQQKPAAQGRPQAERAQQPVRQPRNQRAAAQTHTQQRPNQRAAAPQRTRQMQQVRQAAWQQHRAGNWQADHRTWQQRGGYHGYRIPGDRYLGYFGPSHGFLIRDLSFMVVGGFPRFQYQGYWLSIVDPWPQQWGNDWYENDQVYVSYVDGGYYLYNRSYPGVGIAVSISM